MSFILIFEASFISFKINLLLYIFKIEFLYIKKKKKKYII
jgi:hypothetical protein